MQTFLTHASFSETARILDSKRLNKQKVEAYQILLCNNRVLAHESLYGPYSVPPVAWRNHPAVLMWRYYDAALATYALKIIAECVRRGMKDTLAPKFHEILDSRPFIVPSWIQNPKEFSLLSESHRSSLVNKMPEHYSAIFPNAAPFKSYYWPPLRVPSHFTPAHV